MPFPIAIPIRPRTGQIRPYFLNFLIFGCRTNGGMERTLHMAIRYVIDPAVAQDLLAREPHLRSIITPEEYKLPDEIRLPDQLTRAFTDAVDGQSVLPGVMYVTSVQQTSYDVSRSTSGGTTVWEAAYRVYGFYPE